MRVQLVVCCVLMLDTFSAKCDDDDQPSLGRAMGSRGPKKIRFRNGVEFNEVTRSELLKILATFEESIQKRLSNSQFKKLKPYFTAEFANNKYTKPFIVPKVTQKKNLQLKFT